MRTQLEGERAAVESQLNEKEGARADLTILKTDLAVRLKQFTGKMRSVAPGSRWEAMLPKAFGVSDAMGKVIKPLDDMSGLWERYDGEEGAMTLQGGYTHAAFATQLGELKALYSALASAEIALGLARGTRNETQAAIHPILKQYRQRIPAEFAEGSAILATLPRLTPPDGATPDPVVLSGAYDAAESRAELAWTAPEDPTVEELELRGTAGPEYLHDDESVIATFLPTDPPLWTGTYGLGVPGAAASFKIYTLTAEGNERGSNTVTVERPPD